MTDHAQSPVQPSVASNGHPSSSTNSVSADVLSNPPSPPSATLHHLAGSDSKEVAECDGSDLKASVNQPRPCASPTLSAAMSLQPHTSGPDGTLTLLVADTASADVDSGPSPALVAPSEQQPRLLDPQSSVLPSVLPSNLGLEVSGLCESDHDRSGSLVVQAGHPPSPPLSASNSLLDSISLSNPIDQIPASPQSATQPSAQEVATPDPAGTTPRSNHHLGLLLQGDRPVNSLPRGTDIDSNRQHAAVPAPSLIQETVIQLQSSPSPTTSTSQPFSAHEHTQSLPDPSRSITQPTQSPHPPPRSLLSGLSADNGNRRADHLHPSPPTSSTSTSVLPNSKRPASPCMTASTAPLNGHQDVGSFGQSNDVNGNTLSVTNENSHKRQKLNDEPTPQQPSSVSSHQVPSSSLHTSATISPALAPTAPSPAPNTASIIPSIMPNETRSDWLIPGTPGTRFTRDQQRFTCSVIKHLKKHRSAPPFVVPVDPVALNILDYPNIIKQPMDLGTVEHRLGKVGQPSYYKSAEEFMADVQLIFANCYLYNGHPDVNPISRMALDLSLQFDTQMKKLPSDDLIGTLSSRSPSLAKLKSQPSASNVDLASPASAMKRKISSPATGSPATALPLGTTHKRRSTSPQQSRKKVTKTTAYSTPNGAISQTEGPMGSAAASGRRNSMAADSASSRAKKDAKDTQPVYDTFLPEHATVGKNKRKVSTGPIMILNTKEELKFCKEVLREVNKKAYEKFVWPFYEPVDPVKLCIPDYLKIIKRPMDLSTIRQKLDRGDYKTAAAFAADFRLMLSNCFVFNPEGSPINNLGKQLETLFESKWLDRPPDTIPAPVTAPAAPPPGAVDGELDTLAQIRLEMSQLQERLNFETARKESLTSGYSVAPAPPSKKPSMSKATSAAKNAATVNPTSATTTAPTAASTARASKSNGGSKPKGTAAGARKKSVAASAVTNPAAAKRQILQQQQLQERQQHHSQLHQQAQAAAAANATIFLPPSREPEFFEKIDYEQKKDLATMIQNAVEPMQSEAINLIRSAHPDLVTPDGEEIELDIDALDDRTLYRLYQLVCTAAPPPPPPVVAPPAKTKKAPGVASAKTKAGNGKTGVAKKKAAPRKGIDEHQEAERIKDLEKQLNAFNPPPPPVPASHISTQSSASHLQPTGAGQASAPPPGPVEYASSSSESESESDDESD